MTIFHQRENERSVDYLPFWQRMIGTLPIQISSDNTQQELVAVPSISSSTLQYSLKLQWTRITTTTTSKTPQRADLHPHRWLRQLPADRPPLGVQATIPMIPATTATAAMLRMKETQTICKQSLPHQWIVPITTEWGPRAIFI